jgi:chromosome segregation ATPase
MDIEQKNTAESELNSLLERMVNIPLAEHIGQSGRVLQVMLEEELSYQKGVLGKLRQELENSRSDLEPRLESITRSLRSASSERHDLSDRLTMLEERIASIRGDWSPRMDAMQASQNQLSLQFTEATSTAAAQASHLHERTLAASRAGLAGIETRLEESFNSARDYRMAMTEKLDSLRNWQSGLIALGVANSLLMLGLLGWILFGNS